MDGRRPTEHRRPAQRDAEAPLDGVVGGLGLLQLQPIAEALGQQQPVALVRALVAQLRARGLAARQVARAVGPPRLGDVVGRLVACAACRPARRGTNGGAAMRLFYSVGAGAAACSRPKTIESASACHDASMMFGETPIVVHERSPSEASISTRVTAPVAVAPSRMRTL